MFKYYWGEYLIRTSKTRGNYTHAVLRMGVNQPVVWGCCSSYTLAEKALSAARRCVNGTKYIIVELERR